MSSDIVLALEPVISALEALGVAYRIGGSVVSSVLGVPRSTLDVDIVCTLNEGQVDAFRDRLADAYYVDADMIRDAIRRRSSVNLIHLATMMKVDIFVRRGGPYDREVFNRVTRQSIEEGTREFDLTTAEDIILRKLEWYCLGGEVSERQWSDVIGVLRVQATALDRTYLASWAKELELEDLLVRALREAE